MVKKESVSKINMYRITLLRTSIQIISFILIFGGAFGLAATFIVLPIMAPAGNPYTTVMGAWQLMELMLTAAIFPFLAIAIIVIGSLTIGRSFCAWVCPFGLISDIVSYLGKKKRVSKTTNSSMFKLSIYIAFIFLFIDFSIAYNQAIGTSIYSYFGEFYREPSSIIEPTTILFSMLFWYFYWGLYPTGLEELSKLLNYPPVFWFRLIVLILAISLNYYIPRWWCRWICPLGGLMGIGSKYKILKVYVDPKQCLGEKCGECVKVCPMGVNILDFIGKEISSPLCTSCLMCLDVCPTNAIKVRI